jgi:hypothetical protein
MQGDTRVMSAHLCHALAIGAIDNSSTVALSCIR